MTGLEIIRQAAAQRQSMLEQAVAAIRPSSIEMLELEQAVAAIRPSSIEMLEQAAAQRQSMLEQAAAAIPMRPSIEMLDTFECKSAEIWRAPMTLRREPRAFDAGSPEPAEPPRRRPGFAPWP